MMMELNYELIGQQVRKFRDERNLTQEKLAEHIDMSAQFICYIEKGRKRASLNSLWRMSIALDVTLNHFLCTQPR